MTFTPQEAEGQWYFLDTVKSKTYTVAQDYTASLAA